jgi:membrane protease subunit (stomatin/prohibitin family)
MGVFDFIGKQFIDVIDWTESEDGVLSYRFPMQDREIQNGAKLTVRESQMALFVNEGKVADAFGPGLHTLNTSTLPILTYLQNWDKAFESPFKSDVYFFSTRLQIDQKWGTPTPITIRDKEYGPIRIRANGIYSYKIHDPKAVYLKLSGSREIYRTTDVEGQLRALVQTSLASKFGGGDVPFVDMAANQLKLSEVLKEALREEFTKYGMELDSFLINSVSLPDELQKRLDERASMNIVGDMRHYTQFQAAQSIPVAAANEGGVAGAGAGLGAGLALGQVMGQALQTSGATGGGGASAGEDPLQLLEKLHEMVKKGILTQEEFDKKKVEILKKVGL